MYVQLSDYDIECIGNAKSLIEKDISTHLNIDVLADKSGIGQTKLKEGFHVIYGETIYGFLKRMRMEMACDLLRDRNKTLKQIARAVGYRYTSNFIIAFLKWKGVSPGKFRKNSI